MISGVNSQESALVASGERDCLEAEGLRIKNILMSIDSFITCNSNHKSSGRKVWIASLNILRFAKEFQA